MPEQETLNNNTQKSTFTEKTLNFVAEKTAKVLMDEAEERIKKLLAHEKQIGELHSNFDIFIKRYFTEKSAFDRASQWYGEKAWWNKTLTFISIVSFSALTGAVFNLGALFSIVAISLFAIAHSLLSHHHISNERSTRLYTDIVDMEKELKEEVAKLSHIENCFNESLVQLNKVQLNLLEENQKFEQTITEYREWTTRLLTDIEQLETTKNNLLEINQKLKEQVDQIKDDFKNENEKLQQKTEEMVSLNHQLATIQSNLDTRDKDFTHIHEQYQKKIASLSEIENLFKEQLELLTKKTNRAALKASSEPKTSPLSPETQERLDKTDASLAKGQEELEAFNKFLAEYESDEYKQMRLRTQEIMDALDNKENTSTPRPA